MKSLKSLGLTKEALFLKEDHSNFGMMKGGKVRNLELNTSLVGRVRSDIPGAKSDFILIAPLYYVLFCCMKSRKEKVKYCGFSFLIKPS